MRRAYVQLTELEYRALVRLGIKAMLCPGAALHSLVREAITQGILTDVDFSEWYEREEREIRYDERTAYPLRRMKR